MDEALFEVYSTNTNLLVMGETYTLICNQTEYEVVAHTGAELGIESLNAAVAASAADMPTIRWAIGEACEVIMRPLKAPHINMKIMI